MLAIFLAALLFGFAFNVSPGAVFSETLRRGLTGGFRPALLVQLGSLIGDAVWACSGLPDWRCCWATSRCGYP